MGQISKNNYFHKFFANFTSSEAREGGSRNLILIDSVQSGRKDMSKNSIFPSRRVITSIVMKENCETSKNDGLFPYEWAMGLVF